MNLDLLHDDNVRPIPDSEVMQQVAEKRKQKVAKEEAEDEKGQLHIPYLEYFATNLNRKVKRECQRNGAQIHYAVGRRGKLINIMEILLHKNKNTPMLIGEAGVGKTDIVEGFADALNHGRVPNLLKGYQVYTLNLGLMNNNMNTGEAGYFNSNLTHVIEECKRYRNRIILFIDEFHMIMGASKISSSQGMDASQILKQPLGRNELKVIGATTYDEYFDYIEPDRALQRRLDTVKVPEPNQATTYKILKSNKAGFSKHYNGIKISDKALHMVVKLADRYITDRFEPDKSFDIMDDTFSEALIRGEKVATIKDVALAIFHKTNIPLSSIVKALQPQVAHLGQSLAKRVKGQDGAINTVVKAIDMYFAGLSDPTKPNASFLFLGTTGVGKTELAKSIANTLFGNDRNMIRLDMASFNTSDATAKLIGTRGKRGILTEAVRRQPYSVLLLDEIEKSDPRVWDLLLSILDDGEIQDSRGRTVDFSNLIIIMTSNLAAKAIQNRQAYQIPTDSPEEKTYQNKLFGMEVDSELRRTFKPELVNRLSNRVIFNILDKPQIVRISKRYIDDFIHELRLNNCDVMFDANVIDYLTDLGTDVTNGARPLQRALNHHIKGPIAQMMISREYKDKHWMDYHHVFIISVSGKRPSKTDLWGSRKFNFTIRNNVFLTKEQEQERHNVFSTRSIAKMMALRKDPVHAHIKLINQIQDRIKHLNYQRRQLRLE